MSAAPKKKPDSNLSIEWWPIARPKPYPANARKLSPRAVETLAKSLKEFGWRQPIVVDLKDVIVAGHTRLLAAQASGMERVPVHVARELTAAQIRAYRIMDNRSADETEWDMPTLEAELAELAALEVDLSTTGFDAEELAEFLKPDPLTDEDDTPPVPETPASRVGDLWMLGAHRVLCGDATSDADIKRLMGPHRAAMVFADPPYGIALISKPTGKVGGGTKRYPTREFSKILGDDAPFDPRPLLALAPAVIIWGGNYFADKLLPSQCWLIWNKKHPVERTFAGCEIAWTNLDRHSKIYDCAWDGWTKEGEAGSKVHPSQKAVKVCCDVLADTSSAKAIVLDPYLGSGTTVIAAHKVDRVAFGLELAPAYVDVIVLRWQAFTGQAATLDGDGRTFEKIRAARAKTK